MKTWMVPVSGKVLLQADGKEEALEVAKAYLLSGGLTWLQVAYGAEEVADTARIPPPNPPTRR